MSTQYAVMKSGKLSGDQIVGATNRLFHLPDRVDK